MLRNLFDLACEWSGQILSYNKILGQLLDAGNTTTLAHYLKLLDGAGLIRGLEKFSPSFVRQRASSPKFQVFNTALMSALSPAGKNEIQNRPDVYGRWVESAAGAHLLGQCMTQQTRLYYWREANHEVDFVLSNGKDSIGIEVKSGRQRPFSGIPEFTKRFNPKKVLLVGREGIPLEEFLRLTMEEIFR